MIGHPVDLFQQSERSVEMSRFTRQEWNHRRIKCMYGRFSCEIIPQESNGDF